MSELTAEAARAAADWMKTIQCYGSAAALNEEADRLEGLTLSPEQFVYRAYMSNYSELDGTDWGGVYADVVAHHLGKDGVVVTRDSLNVALQLLHFAHHDGLPSIELLKKVLA